MAATYPTHRRHHGRRASSSSLRSSAANSRWATASASALATRASPSARA